MRAIRAVLVVLVGLSAACPQSGPGPRGPRPEFDVEAAIAALAVPPDEFSEKALARLDQAAAAGDVRSAWAVAHYLIDLFDSARFEPDPDGRAASRTLLFKTTDVATGTGSGTTDLVLDAMLLDVDRVLAADRLHAGALAARTLLESDRTRPARNELFRRMTGLKAIARGKGPLAANARLRLADFCMNAFRDAGNAPTPYRPGILSYCLYPLYDSDPEPYFAEDPARRPPQPAWQDLATEALALLASMGETDSRIAELGAAVVEEHKRYIDGKRGLWPQAPGPGELNAPMVASATPYEWTPLVRLGDGSQKPSAELSQTLAKVLEADRRGRVALALSAEAPATALAAGAQVARDAGADTVELVVGYAQQLKAPPGDYWHGKIEGGKVARLGVIPLMLDTDADERAGGARARGWDPARATLGLHLVLGADAWQLVSPSGALPAIRVGSVEERVKGLREQLALVRRAFPDEDGLVLVPEVGASYAALVAAAQAASVDETGAKLFGMLALGTRRPSTAGKPRLEERTRLRAAAKVELVPDALAPRLTGVRQCYQEALERSPKLAGTITLEVKQPEGAAKPGLVVGGTVKDKTLRGCVTQSLTPAMLGEGAVIKTARITFAPK